MAENYIYMVPKIILSQRANWKELLQWDFCSYACFEIQHNNNNNNVHGRIQYFQFDGKNIKKYSCRWLDHNRQWAMHISQIYYKGIKENSAG